MKEIQNIIILLVIAASLTACGNGNQSSPESTSSKAEATPKEEDHAHDEVSLGKHDIGGISVEAAQGHGSVEPGNEGHLVLKLPYNDNGATIVRAWLGTEDRTLSSVGKGEYAPSHDDYDIHAVAPDPLPANTKWWVEIEKADDTKFTGSIPLLKNISKP
jgi:hypothetical protein